MNETVVDDMVALLPPLLGTLDALTFVSRYLNPLEFAVVLQAAGTPDREFALRARGLTAGRTISPTCARR